MIDSLMESASERLAAMDYLGCEALCRQALELAAEARDYQSIAHILLPLQEARRQRRQLASDAGVFILTQLAAPEAILRDHPRGCLLLIAPPFTDEDATALRAAALAGKHHVEVLLLTPAQQRAAFLQAMEDRGDALLAALPPSDDPEAEVAHLLEHLDEIGDHEIAHQRLAAAAQRAARQSRQ
jgi:hypothetical protein